MKTSSVERIECVFSLNFTSVFFAIQLIYRGAVKACNSTDFCHILREILFIIHASPIKSISVSIMSTYFCYTT